MFRVYPVYHMYRGQAARACAVTARAGRSSAELSHPTGTNVRMPNVVPVHTVRTEHAVSLNSLVKEGVYLTPAGYVQAVQNVIRIKRLTGGSCRIALYAFRGNVCMFSICILLIYLKTRRVPLVERPA